jgi:hypothetical protein
VSYKACGEPSTKTSPLVDFLQIRAEVVQWIEQAQPQLRALLKTAAEHLAGKEAVGRLPALITRTSLEAQMQHALGTCVGEKVTAHAKIIILGALCDLSLSLSLCLSATALSPTGANIIAVCRKWDNLRESSESSELFKDFNTATCDRLNVLREFIQANLPAENVFTLR